MIWAVVGLVVFGLWVWGNAFTAAALTPVGMWLAAILAGGGPPPYTMTLPVAVFYLALGALAAWVPFFFRRYLVATLSRRVQKRVA